MMSSEYITKLRIDIVFKKFFTDKDNIDLLKHFLSAILEIDYNEITDISIANSEELPYDIDGKLSRFDINLDLKDRHIIIEMQMVNMGYFADRTMFYWARKFGNQLKRGESYDKLQPTVSINIMDFKLFDDIEDYHSVYTMADLTNNKVLSDKCEIHYFELPKIDDKIDINNKMKLWMQLIKAESDGELDMLTETKVPEIMSGVTVVRHFSKSEEMQFRALEREKAVRDWNTAQVYYKELGLQEGRTQGIKEGKAQGRAEGIKEGKAQGRAEGIKEGKAQGRAEGIVKGIVEMCIDFDMSFDDTVKKVMLKQGLSKEEANDIVKMYWN